MINKKVHEDDLIAGMKKALASNEQIEATDNLPNVADYLHSAMDILEENGMSAQAEAIFNVLEKIAAKKKKPKQDRATKGLTSEKMLKNLKDHGTEFNLSSDSDDYKKTEELLNKKILPNEVNLADMDKKFADLLSSSDDSDADDLLDLDINDADLEVYEKELSPEMDFEDEV